MHPLGPIVSLPCDEGRGQEGSAQGPKSQKGGISGSHTFWSPVSSLQCVTLACSSGLPQQEKGGQTKLVQVWKVHHASLALEGSQKLINAQQSQTAQPGRDCLDFNASLVNDLKGPSLYGENV